MGEKQTRERAIKAAAELLRPRTDALADLSVAAEAASTAALEKVKADAAAKAAAIMEAARNETAARLDRWRTAYLRALEAGWKASELQAEPLKLKAPPAAKTRRATPARTLERKSSTDAVAEPGASTTTRTPPPAAEPVSDGTAENRA